MSWAAEGDWLRPVHRDHPWGPLGTSGLTNRDQDGGGVNRGKANVQPKAIIY